APFRELLAGGAAWSCLYTGALQRGVSNFTCAQCRASARLCTARVDCDEHVLCWGCLSSGSGCGSYRSAHIITSGTSSADRCRSCACLRCIATDCGRWGRTLGFAHGVYTRLAVETCGR